MHCANSTNALPAPARLPGLNHREYERASRRRLFHSPSRSRFRPPHPLTFGFRLQPSGGASTYSRPVLDATGTLGPPGGSCKRVRNGPRALCELFFFQHFHSDSCSLWRTFGQLSTDDSVCRPAPKRSRCSARPGPVTCPQYRVRGWGQLSQSRQERRRGSRSRNRRRQRDVEPRRRSQWGPRRRTTRLRRPETCRPARETRRHVAGRA